MRLCKKNIKTLAVGVSLCAGVYQIMQTIVTFIDRPIGTEVRIVSNPLDIVNDMDFLYCPSDWLNVTALKEKGFDLSHAWFIQHWVDILTGLPRNEFSGHLFFRHMIDRTRLTADPYFSGQRLIREFDDFDGHGFFVSLFNLILPVYDMSRSTKHEQYTLPETYQQWGQVPEEQAEQLLWSMYNNTETKVLEQLKQYDNDLKAFLPAVALTGDAGAEGAGNFGTTFRYGRSCRHLKLAVNDNNVFSLQFNHEVVKKFVRYSWKTLSVLVEKAFIPVKGYHISAYKGGLLPYQYSDDYLRYKRSIGSVCYGGGRIKIVNSSENEMRVENDTHPACEISCLNSEAHKKAVCAVLTRELGEAHHGFPCNLQCEFYHDTLKKNDKHDDELLNFIQKKKASLAYGDRSLTNSFAVKIERTIRLRSKGSPCVQSKLSEQLPMNYYKAKCEFECTDDLISKFYGGCSISTLLYTSKMKTPTCTPHQYWRAMRLSTERNDTSMQDCLEQCNLLVPCSSIHVEFTNVDEAARQPVSHPQHYTGAGSVSHFVVILPSQIMVIREYEVLPVQTFIANIGGLLGMFCGFSLISAIIWLFKFSRKLRRRSEEEAQQGEKMALVMLRAGVRTILEGSNNGGQPEVQQSQTMATQEREPQNNGNNELIVEDMTEVDF